MESFNKVIRGVPHKVLLESVKNPISSIKRANQFYYEEDRSWKGKMSWIIGGAFFLMTIPQQC